MSRIQARLMAFALVLMFASVSWGQSLKSGDRVAICGDSITEQKAYSVFMESYFVMCQPAGNLTANQFGWGGETASGFLGRITNQVLPLQPTVATTCYGMNDGRYGPFSDAVGDPYRKAQKAIVQAFKAAGVRTIVLGSPGVVDSTTYRRPNAPAEVYNVTLGKLRDIDREIAAEEGVIFADVHGVMLDVMGKAKAKYGPDYHVGGGDGVHPGRNGHLVMAYAFLKALGCDGNIGTITVDLASSKASATEGHKVLSCAAGVVELQSSRYPFCFSGDPKTTDATSGIIEFFPFNQDLNRFVLIVKNHGAARVNVTFGKTSKEFTAEQLAQGVNLAAEFLDNPFCDSFRNVETVIRQKQEFETRFIKQFVTVSSELKKNWPEAAERLDQLATEGFGKCRGLSDQVRDAVKPVSYKIQVTAIQ